jgi:hypothetical protein
MATQQRFRRRLLKGWHRTLKETLQRRVNAAARREGIPCPAADTTGYIRLARAEDPDLLQRLLHLRQLLKSEA